MGHVLRLLSEVNRLGFTLNIYDQHAFMSCTFQTLLARLLFQTPVYFGISGEPSNLGPIEKKSIDPTAVIGPLTLLTSEIPRFQLSHVQVLFWGYHK